MSAFFSAAETALFSLQPAQLRRLRDASPERAAAIDALYASPRRLLSMILLADTLANVPLCVLGLYFLHVFSSWHAAARGFPDDRVPFWPAALLLFVLVVGVCDLLPKVFALRRPERVAPPRWRCSTGSAPCSARRSRRSRPWANGSPTA